MSGPKRTSTHAAFRLRCADRTTSLHERNYPVKLVLFDLDETLTLVTYALSRDDGAELRELLVKVCFESPWVEGSRLDKLRSMFKDLQEGDGKQGRTLAVLSRHHGGVGAVLELLKASGLAEYFAAVWVMPKKPGCHGGAYQNGNDWHFFDPPLGSVQDHKADVCHHIASNPFKWFPQLTDPIGGQQHMHLLGLKPEGIVLVDDQRSNFQSGKTGKQVLRYCKVARYDTRYRDFGFLRNLGGVGAHTDADFRTLLSFVENPLHCKEDLQAHCQETVADGDAKIPVKLVVFDFDETLTLATFMPSATECKTEIGWRPPPPPLLMKKSASRPFLAKTSPEAAGVEQREGEAPETVWTEADLVLYNFESPYVQGSRVAKLRAALKELAKGQDGLQRVLAILTRNDDGVVAVLNLLSMAGLSEFFSAIWSTSSSQTSTGAWRNQNGEWMCFDTPIAHVHEHKADVLQHVSEHPDLWFPQLSGGAAGAGGALEELRQLRPESIVLVDDERANFQSDGESQLQVPRSCKVARYDEDYRDCGALNQMGGLGAHSDDDYNTLQRFVEQPWKYPQEKQETMIPTATDEEQELSLSMARWSTDTALDDIKRNRFRPSMTEELQGTTKARTSGCTLS